MMLPVVRVLVERAGSARYRLLELLGVLPPELLDRRPRGEPWTARVHAAHALGADAPLLDLFPLSHSNRFEQWLTGLPERRTRAIAASSSGDLATAIERAAADRAHLVEALAGLMPEMLDVTASVPGAVEAWGRERRITFYEYLAAWSTHDGDHEQAIRAAIQERPELSTIALTRRRR